MSPDADEVARRFGLGAVTVPWRRLGGLSAAEVWALGTTRGRWVVKVASGRVGGAAETLERAARAAGVRMPPAVAPVHDAGALWADVGGIQVRVWRHVDGDAPRLPADDGLAGWLGTTIATIAGLAIPATVEQSEPVPWAEVIGERTALLAAVTDLDALARDAVGHRPPTVLCHRDINSRNILITADGPVLLDFDHAGAQAPWWELVHHTFLLACRDLGPEEPDRRTVRAALTAYAEAGQPTGPADVHAFGGLVAGLLDWVRTGMALDQAAASLPLVARSLPRWARLLTR